jgi:hypothetical protein
MNITSHSYHEVEKLNQYKKWHLYFYPFLINLYKKFNEILKNNNLSTNYTYDSFCKMMYKNSSKRMPLH